MNEFENVTIIVMILIALGGWLFAWRQHKSNQEERQRDQLLSVRQRKVNRVLEQLDFYAELEDLYRLLANQRSWMVKDEIGQYVKNPGCIHPDR